MASLKPPITYPRRGLHGEVVHRIALQIVSGELQPGDVLSEDDLTSDLAISRTVVREAVRVLSAKGLVEARPRTGTRVKPRSAWNIADPDVMHWRLETGPDSKLFEEMSEVRRGIEPVAAGLAASRATAEEIEAIADAFAGMEAGAGEQAAYLAADLRFHDGILAACHNELMWHLGGILRAVLQTTFEVTTAPPRSRRRALPLHEAILLGIRARDPEAAEEATKALIADTAADLRRAAKRGRLQPT